MISHDHRTYDASNLHDLQAYVLYLFLSLMLSFLNSPEGEEGDFEDVERNEDYELIEYLETKEVPPRLPAPFSLFYPYDLPKGRDFLRFCKFGTLQVRGS